MGVVADIAQSPRTPEDVGHTPIPWDKLVPYERQQGGYWLYGPHCDIYGNGRIWIPRSAPEK